MIDGKVVATPSIFDLGPITTTFGAPSAFTGAPHPGVDIGVPVGTPIPAPVGGEVIRSFRDSIGGIQVVIRTAQGFTETFAHLSHVIAANGSTIAAGDVVGLSGDTGQVTGPHLHYEVRNPSNVAVDPHAFVGEFGTMISTGGGGNAATPTDACAGVPASVLDSIRNVLGPIAVLQPDPAGYLKSQYPDVPVACLRQIAYEAAGAVGAKSGVEQLVQNGGKALGFLTLSSSWAKIAFTVVGAAFILTGVLLYTGSLKAGVTPRVVRV